MLIIGDVKESDREDPLALAAQVWEDSKDRTGIRPVEMIEDDRPAQSKVSRMWGRAKGQATIETVRWSWHMQMAIPTSTVSRRRDEPWKDARPDAPHERLRSSVPLSPSQRR